MKKRILFTLCSLLCIISIAKSYDLRSKSDYDSTQTVEDTKIIELQGSATYDLCNDARVLSISEETFLTDVLKSDLGIDQSVFKVMFGDYHDFAGAPDGDWEQATAMANGSYLFNCNLYATINSIANRDTYGRVECRINPSTGIPSLYWYLTSEEMEYITHDKADNKGRVSVYIRWTGKSEAPYQYLWAKLTAEITRENVEKYAIAEKNINYWYDYETGDRFGLSAVISNVDFPLDFFDTKFWIQSLCNDWLCNQIFLTNASDGTLVTTKCHNKDANVTTLDEDISISPLSGNSSGQTTKGHVSKGAKFYFVPEPFKVIVPANAHNAKDVTYNITPYGYTNMDWNMLIPRYISHKLATSPSYFVGHDNNPDTPALPTCKLDTRKHEWTSEENANNVINSCAIDYDAGCFNNDKLYAERNGRYTLIATLDQSRGELSLVHYDEVYESAEFNVVSDVLNAIGYDNQSENHHANNINRELRAKIGVIAKTRCGLAAQMQDATWMVSWERPINVTAEEATVKLSDTNEKVYMADILKLYDWRGPVHGDMEKAESKWLWAYYNIHKITVDCTPSVVITNLNQSNGRWTRLSEFPGIVICPDTLSNTYKKEFVFDLHNLNNGTSIRDYNYAPRSLQLYDIFTAAPYTYKIETGQFLPDGTPKYIDVKATFGYINFSRIAGVTSSFDVIVPVTVSYEWGDITTNVKIHVEGTDPQYDNSIQEGIYFVKNKATGTYMTNANAWGTQLSLSEACDMPIQFKRSSVDSNAYNLLTGIVKTDGHIAYSDNKAWVDGDANYSEGFNSYFVNAGNGYYHITYDGKHFLGSQDGSTEVSTEVSMTSEESLWQIIPVSQVKAEVLNALSEATATSPVDATVLIDNAAFKNTYSAATDWTDFPTLGSFHEYSGYASCAEKFNCDFNVSQTLTGIPNGYYRISAKAAYRSGGYDVAAASRSNGHEILNSYLYGNDTKEALPSILDFAQDDARFVTDDWKSDANTSYGFIPNSLEGAAKYMKYGDITPTDILVYVSNGTLQLGVKNESHIDLDWTIFTDFHLYYYGTDSAIAIANVESANAASAVYSVSGVRTVGLQKGINVVKYKDGSVKKVLVK